MQSENQQQTEPTNGTGPESIPGHIVGRRTLSPLCLSLCYPMPFQSQAMQSSHSRYHVCFRYGWLSIVESLLVGRNVRMINLQNNTGMTPLHLACSNGHDQVVEHLLSEGATIEKYV